MVGGWASSDRDWLLLIEDGLYVIGNDVCSLLVDDALLMSALAEINLEKSVLVLNFDFSTSSSGGTMQDLLAPSGRSTPGWESGITRSWKKEGVDWLGCRGLRCVPDYGSGTLTQGPKCREGSTKLPRRSECYGPAL